MEIAVDAALKGTAARPGEHVRLLSEGEWFQHTHAAAIKGGRGRTGDARYATPIPDAQIKPGAAVLVVFVRGDAPRPASPRTAAFLAATGAYRVPERAADVARMKTAALATRSRSRLGGRGGGAPDGLEVEIKGHTHKRPLVGGPQKESVEIEARIGTRADLIALVGHVVEPAPRASPRRKPGSNELGLGTTWRSPA